MNNSTLNTLLREYEKKKFNAEIKFENEKNSFCNSHPDLKELNDTLNSTALDISKSILNNNSELTDKLKSDFEELKQKKAALLKTLDIPAAAKEPLYECKICKDTGFVNSDNQKSVLCNCIKQRIFDIEFNKSNIGNLEKENFENFSLDLYSDEINEEKYASKISPRQNIDKIKNTCLSFIDNFDAPNEKNLLFYRKYWSWKNFSFKLYSKRNIV